MIAYGMLYATTVGLPILLAAIVCSAVVRKQGRAERGVWLVALGLALAMPVVVLTSPLGETQTASAPLVETGLIGLPAVVAVPAVPIVMVPFAQKAFGLDEVLVGLWLLASLILVIRWAVAALRLSRLANSWPVTSAACPNNIGSTMCACREGHAVTSLARVFAGGRSPRRARRAPLQASSTRRAARRRAALGSTLALPALLGLGCSDGGTPPASSVSADEAFELVREVLLDEPEGFPITGIDDMAVLPGGGFVIVDSKAGQIRLHGADGAMLRIVSETGEGPGEFRRPLRVTALDDGTFVAAGANPRLSHFDARGDLIRDIEIEGLGAVELEAVHGSMVLFAAATSSTATYTLIDLADSRATFVHARDSSYSTNEEWRVAVRDHATVLNGSIFIAASLAYPILKIGPGGLEKTAFGAEPRSWEQATRPEPSTQVMQRLPHWLVSFTFISGIVSVGDEWLLVQHARFVESPSARLSTLFAWQPYAFDVYAADGTRVLHDVALTNRVLAADSLAYILIEEPPTSWVIGVMRPRFDGVSPGADP